jgi:hypothetical protein
LNQSDTNAPWGCTAFSGLLSLGDSHSNGRESGIDEGDDSLKRSSKEEDVRCLCVLCVLCGVRSVCLLCWCAAVCCCATMCCVNVFGCAIVCSYSFVSSTHRQYTGLTQESRFLQVNKRQQQWHWQVYFS